MRHSYSSLSTLAACESKYAYRYVRGLLPIEDSGGPAEAGNAIHALIAVDALDRGHRAGSLLETPSSLGIIEGMRVLIASGPDGLSLLAAGSSAAYAAASGLDEAPCSPQGLLDLIAAWFPAWRAAGREEAAQRLADALGAEDPSEALRRLWARYAARWAAERESEAPLLVEASWAREIPGTEIVLQGRADEVYRDRRSIIVVRDHKLSGGWHHDPDHLVDLHGYQLHLGAWGLSPLVRELGAGRGLEGARIEGIEYNRGIYTAPSTPVLTKGSAKTPPRLSKAVTKYDLATYLEFCQSEAAAAAGYEAEPEIIERLTKAESGDEWWRRSSRPVSLSVVRRHVRAAAAQARRAEILDPSEAMPSPGPGCSWCAYAALCRAENYGGFPEPFAAGDYGLRIREAR